MSTGRPRSRSNRANASNGEVVSTPPKSQITASIIPCPRQCLFAKAASMMRAAMPARAESLGDGCAAGYCCRDEILHSASCCRDGCSRRPLTPSSAARAPRPMASRRSVVTIVGSRGNFCTGSVIAPTLVLTVAHCVQPGADYKIVQYGADETPQLQDVQARRDPSRLQDAGDAGASRHRRRGAAAAGSVRQGKIAGAARHAAAFRSPSAAASPSPASASPCAATARAAARSAAPALVATGKPGTLQIRLVDPATQGARDGLGACTGDSGAPVFEDQAGWRRDRRRRELVDRAERQRRLRRYHRRDAANALSRLDFADRAAMGRRRCEL